MPNLFNYPMSPFALDRELDETIGQPGCPVCRIVRRDEERYWSYFLYAAA